MIPTRISHYELLEVLGAGGGEALPSGNRVEPSLIRGHYYYGRSLFAASRMAESEAMMRRAAELRSEDYQAIGILTMILRKVGRHEEAKQISHEALNRIERWLEINPRDARALYLGALRYVELGEGESGRPWVERALALAPDDSFALYNAACFYSLLGEPDRALDLLEKMAQTDQAGTSKDWMINDPDLDPLRGTHRFQSILSRLL